MALETAEATTNTDMPVMRVATFSHDLETVIKNARSIMTLGDEERNARMATHGLYVSGNLDQNTLSYTSNLSQRAMVERVAGRQLLTGNRLIAYRLAEDDIIVGPAGGRNVLFGAHYEAGQQAGKLAVGNEIHFAINGPRDDLYDTMAYLAITNPDDDSPTGLHVGITQERLDMLAVVERGQAVSSVQQAGQIAVPQSNPVFLL